MNNRKLTNHLGIAGLLLALGSASAQAENMIPAVGDTPYANPPMATAPAMPAPPRNEMVMAPSAMPRPADQSAMAGQDSIGASGLPQPVRSGDIRYITGGIGDEERGALESVKNDYNVHVTSVNEAGEFLGDTQITILNRKGEALVQTTAGPMFYASLPPGIYTVEALNGGQTKTKKISVGPQKKSSLYLRW